MEGKSINPKEARVMCDRYNQSHKGGTQSVYFSPAAVAALTAWATNGLRVHNAMKEDGSVTVILDDGVTLMEFGAGCPPICPEKLHF